MTFFQIADQQLELFDVPVELLGRPAEPGVAQEGQLQLQLLDVQGLGVEFDIAGGELTRGGGLQVAELGLQRPGEGPKGGRIGGEFGGGE